MKKIINGKMYDTETATEIGYWSNDLSSRDFKNCTEYLYRKKTGEFFLHGWGGPASRYAKPCGNLRSEGENIIPITEAEAKKWLECYSDVDTYIEVFGDPEE